MDYQSITNLPPAIAALCKLLGITPAEARAIMPGDDNSLAGYPGAIIRPDDGETDWGAQEHQRFVDEFNRGRPNNRRAP